MNEKQNTASLPDAAKIEGSGTETCKYNNTLIHGIIGMDSDESQRLLEIMTKKQYVDKHHKRAISYIKSKDIWRTYVGSPRKEVTRRKQQDLIVYLYNYYREAETAAPTFAEIFALSQEYKRNVENRSVNTITRNWNAYHRFISDSFGNTEITMITDIILNRYITETTQKLHPTEKDLKNFLGILRQTFRYAYKCARIISVNPARFVETTDYYNNCANTVLTGDTETFSPEQVEHIREALWERIDSGSYDPYLYAILFSIETGARIGEIPPLRWNDIDDNVIHIHRQQRAIEEKGNPIRYEELPYTKDERRHPKGGRYFPITVELSKILNALRIRQEKLEIHSEFVFGKKNGEWISKKNLGCRIHRLCKSFGLSTRKNHAFRKSLNSNVLIPLGLTAPDRAYLLGHSVDTNLKHYSYSRMDRLDQIRLALNGESVHAPFTQTYVPEFVGETVKKPRK